MAYFTDGSTVPDCAEPAAIDLNLPIGPPGQSDAGSLPYWPKYHDLEVRQRRYYLQWLAQGRNFCPDLLGFTFLFFYGLERRAILDKEDQGLIFTEVMRLRHMYEASGVAVSHSWNSYSACFLWFLIVVTPDKFTITQVQDLCESSRYWREEQLASLLCWFASHEMPLPDWAAFIIAENLPESQRSVVIRRVPEQFHTLFCKRYDEQFKDALTLTCAKKDRTYAYRAASALFQNISVIQINPMGITSQFKPLAQIWNGCLEELRRLSTLVAKDGQEELTHAKWEAMPADLREGVEHPLTDSLCQLINESPVEGRSSIVSTAALARVLQIGNDDHLTLGQSRKICEMAEGIGYCVEPDARILSQAYRPGTMVAMFLRTTEEKVNPQLYLAGACMTHIGLMIAAADGATDQSELTVLDQELQRLFGLGGAELQRLDALRSLLCKIGPDTAAISRISKALTPAQRAGFGKLALAMVVADGVVTNEELKALRTCYAKLVDRQPRF